MPPGLPPQGPRTTPQIPPPRPPGTLPHLGREPPPRHIPGQQGPPPLPHFPNAPGGPGGAPVAFGIGTRVDRRSPFTPGGFLSAAFFGAGAYAVARATGGGAVGGQVTDDEQPLPTNLAVSRDLQQRQFQIDRDELERGSRMSLRTEIPFLLSQVDEFLFGKEKDFALSKLLGGAGQGGKVQVNAVKEFIVGSARGGGEEDAIARMNAANAALRDRLAALALAALSVTPPLSGGGPGVDVIPVWEADP